MKKSFVLLMFIFFLFASFSNNIQAQYFNKYYTWASEKHIWPGTNDVRLPFVYKNILFTQQGNFYGATTRNGVNIPSIAYLMKERNFPSLDTLFAIYTVESQGYRVFDPAFDYCSSLLVNEQEGLDLDELGDVINGEAAASDAFTEHPTIERFRYNAGF
jgi:hypothetical protein